MVREHWHFTAPPFDGALEPATFYAGAPQIEALARLEWLLEQRQRFGLVVGAEGYGKSHLAAMAVRRLGGLGAEAVMLSLRGLAPGDWIALLLERLPLDPISRAEPLRLWQKLENRLRENTLMERPTALVFDDLDAAPQDAIDGILRLIGAAEPRYARTVVVAMVTPQGLPRLPDGIRQRAAVRIELAAWGTGDVQEFLTQALCRVGGVKDIFSADAVATLTRFAGGVPRVVGQLARLALAAAAGDGLSQIDAGTVERAWRELAPSAESSAQPSGGDVAQNVRDTLDEATASNPRVRVVRRLWG